MTTRYQVPPTLHEKVAVYLTRHFLHMIIARCQAYLRALDGIRTATPDEIIRAQDVVNKVRGALMGEFGVEDFATITHTFDTKFTVGVFTDLVKLLGGDPVVPPPPPPPQKKKKGKKR